CYVTGIGQKSPLNPHHRISMADGIDDPIPGLLVGGPNPSRQDQLDYPTTHPDEVYLDVTESFASNEVAINWNASLVTLLGGIEAALK
ncbi:MAG: glycoside hydrolase family 9 protein, partial [Bacteroidales bacterium]|nr:glycoside hydrolase family 9 protein [Bacteroidales bacterium]